MKKISYVIIILVLVLFNTIITSAAVRLPSIIGSHMVLKQNSEVNLWGWCSPSEKIVINTSWDTITYQTTGESSAKWSLKIKTPPAGGPYSITINKTIILDDVMIGEVWLCGGQSNMEFSGDHGLKQSIDEAPVARNQNIRFFYIQKSTSEFPQDNCEGIWKVCTPEEMIHFSAVGYFFGKQLQQSLNVPVGLINSNWGGTAAEVWTPGNLVSNDPVLKAAADKLLPAPWWPSTPGYSYNAMINPITNYEISGAIWYQGEGNAATYWTYKPLMKTMIESWRQEWGNDFPFYFVQIAPFSGYGFNNICALEREAQTSCLSIPNTGMVVISDLVDDLSNIHPVNKTDVATRLANLALSETYGISGLPHKFPMYKDMEREKNRIRISFENADNGLMVKGKTISEFYIAGDDHQFLPATARIEGNSVVVWNKTIKEPVAVRFGFSNASIPNLFSMEGLPVNLFRTDKWDIDTSPVKK